MIRTIFGVALLVASFVCQAQTPSETIEGFLHKVATSASDQALDDLFAGSGFAETKPQDIITLKSQTRMAMGLYGTPIGIEKIREEDLSPSLKRIVYIQKFERYPVAWEFYFYKPKDKWMINTLNFRDQIALILGAKQ